MTLASKAFVCYSALRSVALFAKPEMIQEMFPHLLFAGKQPRWGDDPAETAQVAAFYARALATLILACGMLALGGVKGRFGAFAIIFPMFYFNHVIDGVGFPPLVPVVVCNVIVLAANVYEAMRGGSVGKGTYIAMQGGFGLLFLTEPAFLVQDPFTFAKEGTSALFVGQKLGFAIGMILTMHAVMTLFEQPTGCVAAMSIVLSGMAKMAVVDGIPLPASSVGAAGVCMALCLVDLVRSSGAKSKEL